MTLAEIQALLEGKFPGVRKDVLKNLAGVISLQTEDESAVKTIVDQWTADKVTAFAQSYRSDIDREIQQSVQTNEKKLKEKYDFVDKKPQEQQKPQQQTGSGGLTLEAIQTLLQQQMAPLQQQLEVFKSEKVRTTRKEQFAGLFKDKKIPEETVNMMTSQFDRMNFKDDEDFNTYLAQMQPTIDKMAQQQIDDTLRGDRVPGFGQKTTDGVDQAVLDFLKGGNKEDVGGKAI